MKLINNMTTKAYTKETAKEQPDISKTGLKLKKYILTIK